MRFTQIAIAVFLLAAGAFAQADRGTITGTIADPAGAVVASAPIEARNIETGATYRVASTETGNYTLAQLPAGSYEMSVAVAGFKKFVRQNIVVQVAQTLRIDVGLEVGSPSESVTVTEAVALLKTESGELSHNVSTERLDNLPVLGIGAAQAGSAGIRNPLAVVQLIPGTFYIANNNLRVNGAPNNTAAVRIEGQDASNGQVPGTPAQTQPSVDAIQEVSIQTSNYAAEYGQVGGGFFNFTMKSGTNQFHGSAYDYFVNEALNAGQPFTNNGKGGLVRSVQRRNDYGFTVGGPVWLPKLYNGHDKTFFFFNFEQFREFQNISTQAITVPIAPFRSGDFRRALTGRTLATDPLARPILEGAIYDPATQRLAANGQIIRDQFPNNTIPLAQFDPVSVKVQALIPNATNQNLPTSNFVNPYRSDRVTSIPSFKLDESLGSKAKLSFYFSSTKTASQYSPTLGASDGLPLPITAAIGTFDVARLYRLNFDYTLTPTLLLHLGAGFQDNTFNDNAPVLDYDAEKELGLKGATVKRMFPAFTGLSNAQGGMKNMGPGTNRNLWYAKPTANVSVTWVKSNHTYKFGAEMKIEGSPGTLYAGTNGAYAFSGDQTTLPSTQGQNLSGGVVGAPYASFLLGLVASGNISNPTVLRAGKSQWGGFAQDTWKITRKLTLDYGLRYDYSTYFKEQYNRFANFSPTAINPTAGGHPGAVIFEGSEPGHCDCNFAHNYPWAFGPRLGAAYQINSKTVLRLGWGLVYSGTADANAINQQASASTPFSSSAFAQPVTTLKVGVPVTARPWPNFDPGQFPLPGQINSPSIAIDQNSGRPARQNQWSIGLQREVFRNLVVEAAYVGNRGAWWIAPGLIDVNANRPDQLKAAGLDVNSAADRTLLTSRLDSTTAAGRGFNKLPYNGFPTSLTVAQALRPFPQFGNIIYFWSPLGNTWYDSLQTKVTQRFSHGLSLTSVFTWQKNLTSGNDRNPTAGSTGNASFNDVFNRGQNKYFSSFDQAYVFNISANYTVPAFRFGNQMAGKVASWVVRDWAVSTLVSYSGGLPIKAPTAQNQLTQILFRGTYANRVADQPLFTQDLNCHCFDPNKTFVLNPKAWADPAAGQWGTSAAFYGDYRYQRRPVENIGIGRIFRFTERVTFNIRAEFTNAFNRTEMADPTATNALATQTTNSAGQTTAGFGFINTTSVAQPPRQGTVVARFQF